MNRHLALQHLLLVQLQGPGFPPKCVDEIANTLQVTESDDRQTFLVQAVVQGKSISVSTTCNTFHFYVRGDRPSEKDIPERDSMASENQRAAQRIVEQLIQRASGAIIAGD